jgi:hypothetical protein
MRNLGSKEKKILPLVWKREDLRMKFDQLLFDYVFGWVSQDELSAFVESAGKPN